MIPFYSSIMITIYGDILNNNLTETCNGKKTIQKRINVKLLDELKELIKNTEYENLSDQALIDFALRHFKGELETLVITKIKAPGAITP